ncbi:uncharacterized protein B0J16DRAFT_359120 [Fusarium flagelliforme]|uniref:uncharacterized protein n=1 Tax=Fusarium flagelliforme TaxID=2675880 RepID=UPI001E8ED14F|nr:uncharacterized protein B0J16DRAFT_359120 [Fusarium flagelliforme]KAH7169787.1 hypothetical protein B0J16DRAFT_359120 [Fusarium flagelliforme]
MSGPAFVVMPVQTGGAQQSEQGSVDGFRNSKTINKSRNPDDHNLQEERGPLKELIAHKDSLYKYMNWEDPVRTLGSYLSVLNILFGAHYLPLTQLAVKAGAIIFGVICLTEFVSRKFGPNTFLFRLRSKKYKTVPEHTLNATLRDVHDFIQYAVVDLQKIIYGQDLGKTFAAFLSFTSVFWLMKVASPFLLAVLGLTSLYIAPLINSPHGRAVAQDATARGKELANTAAEKGKTLAEDTKFRAAELSSKARESSEGVQQHVGNLTQSRKQTANDLSDQATAENAEKLRDMGVDAISKAPGIAKPSSDDAEQDTCRSPSSNFDGGSDDHRYDTSGAANNVSQFSDDIYNTPRRMAPYSNTVNRIHYPNTTLKNREDVASSMSGQTAGG